MLRELRVRSASSAWGSSASSSGRNLSATRRCKLGVLGLVDYSHPTLAQFLCHVIVRNGLPFQAVATGLGLCSTEGFHRLRPLHGNQEPVTPPRQRLNERRLLRGIFQCLAQALDGGIDAAVELDNRSVRPEFSVQLSARDDLAGVLDQQAQNLNRLIGRPDFDPVSAQLTGAQI